MQIHLGFALAALALFASLGPKKVPKPSAHKPSAHKTPSGAVDWNRTLVQPGGEAATGWISPQLTFQATKVNGVGVNRDATLVVINPDLKARVDVHVRCYAGDPKKPVFEARPKVRPVEIKGISIVIPAGARGPVKFFCHIGASKPVFAYAHTWSSISNGQSSGRPFIPMFRA